MSFPIRGWRSILILCWRNGGPPLFASSCHKGQGVGISFLKNLPPNAVSFHLAAVWAGVRPLWSLCWESHHGAHTNMVWLLLMTSHGGSDLHNASWCHISRFGWELRMENRIEALHFGKASALGKDNSHGLGISGEIRQLQLWSRPGRMVVWLREVLGAVIEL